ncbi:MAG TPA: hypothetical protein VF772_01475 [Terriglobales bacterium]
MSSAGRERHQEERTTTEREFQRISRRELLKLSPILVASAIVIPKLRDPLLKAGLRLSDRAAQGSFREKHLAETFADREVAPLEKFPYNYYDVRDPEVDLATWSLSCKRIGRESGRIQTGANPDAPESRAEHAACVHRGMVGDRAFRRCEDLLIS